jgi:hypothetical protein
MPPCYDLVAECRDSKKGDEWTEANRIRVIARLWRWRGEVRDDGLGLRRRRTDQVPACLPQGIHVIYSDSN